MITDLTIKNFKSIKELNFEAKRINLFIGAPNVGKSNILEALSLFCIPFSKDSHDFQNFIRFTNLKNLYYDNITRNTIEVKTNMGVARMAYNENHLLRIAPSGAEELAVKEFGKIEDLTNEYNQNFKSENDAVCFFAGLFKNNADALFSNYSPLLNQHSIRKFEFSPNALISDSSQEYLLPPFGENLVTIVQNHPELLLEIASFFEDYNLFLLYDDETNIYQIQTYYFLSDGY